MNLQNLNISENDGTIHARKVQMIDVPATIVHEDIK